MIELRPGETLALHAVAPATAVLRVGFEWDAVLNNRPFEIDLATFLLERRGHEIVCASDGPAGIARAAATRPKTGP